MELALLDDVRLALVFPNLHKYGQKEALVLGLLVGDERVILDRQHLPNKLTRVRAPLLVAQSRPNRALHRPICRPHLQGPNHPGVLASAGRRPRAEQVPLQLSLHLDLVLDPLVLPRALRVLEDQTLLALVQLFLVQSLSRRQVVDHRRLCDPNTLGPQPVQKGPAGIARHLARAPAKVHKRDPVPHDRPDALGDLLSPRPLLKLGQQAVARLAVKHLALRPCDQELTIEHEIRAIRHRQKVLVKSLEQVELLAVARTVRDRAILHDRIEPHTVHLGLGHHRKLELGRPAHRADQLARVRETKVRPDLLGRRLTDAAPEVAANDQLENLAVVQRQGTQKDRDALLGQAARHLARRNIRHKILEGGREGYFLSVFADSGDLLDVKVDGWVKSQAESLLQGLVRLVLFEDRLLLETARGGLKALQDRQDRHFAFVT